MSNASKILIGIVLIVIIGGLIWHFSNWGSTGTSTTATSTEQTSTTTTTSSTGAQNTGSSMGASANTTIDQDTANVDAQLKELNNDSTAADTGLSSQ